MYLSTSLLVLASATSSLAFPTFFSKPTASAPGSTTFALVISSNSSVYDKQYIHCGDSGFDHGRNFRHHPEKRFFASSLLSTTAGNNTNSPSLFTLQCHPAGRNVSDVYAGHGSWLASEHTRAVPLIFSSKNAVSMQDNFSWDVVDSKGVAPKGSNLLYMGASQWWGCPVPYVDEKGEEGVSYAPGVRWLEYDYWPHPDCTKIEIRKA